MSRDPSKLYRFAFFGRSGSGKSCYLGMLGLGAQSDSGFTCDYLPVEVPKPDPSKDQPTPAEREALGLHAGEEWMEGIMAALQQGDVPSPNPAVFDAALPTLDFRVGDPARGASTIRLVDYSGELINPAIEHDPESFVRKLRSVLAEMEGLMVFAEVPRNNGSAVGPLAPELRRIRQAFASLHESKSDPITTPVCVVLTKWDRYSTIDRQSPHAEQQKLEQFLAAFPEYESLVQSISNAVAAQPPALDEDGTGPDSPDPTDLSSLAEAVVQGAGQANEASQAPGCDRASTPVPTTPQWGLKRGNIRVFAASSFGSARLVNGKEVPDRHDRPFGLVEPLVWLAHRRDALDLAALDQRCKRGRWWSLPFAFLAPSARAARRERARLGRRIPAHTRCGHHLAEIRRTLLARLVLSCLATALVLVVGSSLSWSYVRHRQFTHYATAANDPRLTPEQLDRAIGFFRSYINWGWWNGPLAPSADEARQQIDRLNQRIEEVYWHPVEAASDPRDKAQAAQNYLTRVPNGRRAAEANAIVAQWEAETARRQGEEKNRQWLEEFNQRLGRADSLRQIDDVLQDLTSGAFPAPDHVTAEQRSQRDKLLNDAKQRRAEVAWQEFVKSYRDQLSQGELAAAADTLSGYTPRDSQWQDLARKFPDEVDAGLKARLPDLLRDANNFAHARDLVRNALDALKRLESTLRPEDPQLADEMFAAQRKVRHTWQAQVDEGEDKYLYEAVRTSKSKNACDNYLTDAPLKAMQAWVKKYRNYLEQLEGELEVTVALRILWDKEYHGDLLTSGDNDITVAVDGKRVSGSGNSIPEDPGMLSGEVCQFKLKGKTGKSFDINVSILEDDKFATGRDDDGGSGSQRCTIEQLKNEVRIPLRPKQGGFTNYAVLTVTSGWPQEPALPDWQKAE